MQPETYKGLKRLTRRRFSRYEVLLTHEPASFCWENAIAVFTPLWVRASTECCNGGNKLSNVRSFIIMWLAEGLTAINKDNSADFLGEKKYNEEIRGGGCLFFDNTQENFK